eukprot:CAMPEP_0185921714 /NCGR_PEP_ID=MMETSP0924C-20121207/9287_1 /TAXON_ID=321610 /ORGANISM="Perkinsus chesapeaki, Strain ATCC PRA-65" /LENGTH=75 /DNA_ID=CAMNT_0028653193 /DNA_START=1 /DNA_END=224 /DNA_ORIENTATION=-
MVTYVKDAVPNTQSRVRVAHPNVMNVEVYPAELMLSVAQSMQNADHAQKDLPTVEPVHPLSNQKLQFWMVLSGSA